MREVNPLKTGVGSTKDEKRWVECLKVPCIEGCFATDLIETFVTLGLDDVFEDTVADPFDALVASGSTTKCPK